MSGMHDVCEFLPEHKDVSGVEDAIQVGVCVAGKTDAIERGVCVAMSGMRDVCRRLPSDLEITNAEEPREVCAADNADLSGDKVV